MKAEAPPPHDVVSETSQADWRTWLVGALFSLTMVLGAAGFHSLDARITDLERSGSPPFRERVATVEARQSALQRQVDAEGQVMRESLKRIEEKLDIALDRLHNKLLR